ncbi:MAG: TrmB family transcriptional regulator [Promethearchaeota archaeon]
MSDLKLSADLEKQLMSIGLTSYQARVYRAVYILKECNISQIANYSKVPTAKIYTIIKELGEMGLIAKILKSRPAMFKAFPPDQYIEREKNRIIKIGHHIKESLAVLENFREEKGPIEEHETLLLENELLTKNLILNSLTSLTRNVFFVAHHDFDFYEEVFLRLNRELKSQDSSTISITVINLHERKINFSTKFSHLDIKIIKGHHLDPNLVESLKKIPLLFVIDERFIVNVTQTEQNLEYLYLKSSSFANFLRSLIKNIKKEEI